MSIVWGLTYLPFSRFEHLVSIDLLCHLKHLGNKRFQMLNDLPRNCLHYNCLYYLIASFYLVVSCIIIIILFDNVGRHRQEK